MKSKHVGNMIKQRVKELHLSHTEFAAAIHSSRSNVYNIYNMRTMDVEQLARISEVLDYDFVKLYCKDAEAEEQAKVLISVEYVDGKMIVKQEEMEINKK